MEEHQSSVDGHQLLKLTAPAWCVLEYACANIQKLFSELGRGGSDLNTDGSYIVSARACSFGGSCVTHVVRDGVLLHLPFFPGEGKWRAVDTVIPCATGTLCAWAPRPVLG